MDDVAIVEENTENDDLVTEGEAVTDLVGSPHRYETSSSSQRSEACAAVEFREAPQHTEAFKKKIKSSLQIVCAKVDSGEGCPRVLRVARSALFFLPHY
jgi:hypothetical protein